MEKKDSTTITELLNIGKVTDTVPELVSTPPTVTQQAEPKQEVTLSNTERSPAAWRILPGEGDQIEANCGGHMFRGTSKEFSAMLRAGKYMK